ncbi:MAG: SCO family protein [Neisseria sp.]|nr:SCO family protein [Neisseria sp.]
MKKLLSALAVLTALSACSPETAQQAPASATQAEAVKWNGTDVRKEDIGGDFVLTGGDGKEFALSSLKGKVVVLNFGYTHCPDICPMTLQIYNDVLAELGEQAKDVAVVFVSVDPERDHPELVGRYAKQFNPDFIGLTAANGQSIAEVKQQYRIVSAKAKQQSDDIYLVDHSTGAYLLDKNGEAALFEPYAATAVQIAEDIKNLLK